MKKFFIAVAVAAYFCSGIAADLTLAQKLALAKKMADAAAQGKEKSGLVVGGDFDFSKMVEKYREKPVFDTNALPEVRTDVAEKNTADSEADFNKQNIAAAPKEIAKPSVLLQVRTDISAAKSKLAKSAKNLVSASVGGSTNKTTGKEQTPTAGKIQTPLVSNVELAKAPHRESSAKIVSGSAEQKSKKSKYVVDTSDFKNGYYLPQAKGETLPLPKPVENISAWSNGAFYLITDDATVISDAKKVLDEVCSMFGEYESGSLLNFKLHDKIVVQIITDKAKPRNILPYVVDKNGGVTLTVYWDEKLDFAYFCRLISGALYRKVVEERTGRNIRECPVWLDEALTKALQCRMQFGLIGELAETSAENPPRDLTDTIKIGKIDSLKDSADCFWTLKTIESLAARNGKFFTVLLSFANATDEKVLANIKKLRKDNFEAVWHCTITGEIYSRLGGIYNTKTSREEIMRLMVLQAEDINGEPLGLTPDKVWKYRENGLVRYNIERRLLEIKVLFPRINPLYAETLVDLGRVLEAALDDDSDEFATASASFAENYKRAGALAEHARRMLLQ